MDRKTKDNNKLCEFLEGVRKRCPENRAVLEALGDHYTKVGRVDDGLVVDELLTSKDPDNETYSYNLACSYALLGRHEEAMAALIKAVKLGYDDSEWMLNDNDLDSIKRLPEFKALVEQLKTASNEMS